MADKDLLLASVLHQAVISDRRGLSGMHRFICRAPKKFDGGPVIARKQVSRLSRQIPPENHWLPEYWNRNINYYPQHPKASTSMDLPANHYAIFHRTCPT